MKIKTILVIIIIAILAFIIGYRACEMNVNGISIDDNPTDTYYSDYIAQYVRPEHVVKLLRRLDDVKQVLGLVRS